MLLECIGQINVYNTYMYVLAYCMNTSGLERLSVFCREGHRCRRWKKRWKSMRDGYIWVLVSVHTKTQVVYIVRIYVYWRKGWPNHYEWNESTSDERSCYVASVAIVVGASHTKLPRREIMFVCMYMSPPLYKNRRRMKLESGDVCFLLAQFEPWPRAKRAKQTTKEADTTPLCLFFPPPPPSLSYSQNSKQERKKIGAKLRDCLGFSLSSLSFLAAPFYSSDHL